MNDINFEEDRKESFGAVNEAKEFSDQVVKLRSLQDEIEEEDKKIKEFCKSIILILFFP